jgi:GH15 family glucan-1,4-alpha-glucosidase
MADFPEIGELAAIGDARTTALIGPTGAVELLCLPQLDEQIVFGRLLDPSAGAFELEPAQPATADVAYLRDTNVLRTRWCTEGGEAVVHDALIGGPGGEAATSTLVRRVDCTSGRISMRYRLMPRFRNGVTEPTRVTQVPGGHRIEGPDLALSFGVPDNARYQDGEFRGEAELAAGDRLTLTFGVGPEPIGAAAAAGYVDATSRAWRAWTASLNCEGRWAEAIKRSALALRMLIRDDAGSIAAAGSLGLPEQPGGPRNYDYRYCWLRDASFVVDALCSIGARESARRYAQWLGGALASTSPRLQPFYRMDGGKEAEEYEAELLGYRGSSPVRIGNRAFKQLQLGSSGDMLQSCVLMRQHGVDLPPQLRDGIVRAVEHLTEIWREPDSGIWELEPRRQYTWSKMACWIAFTRAAELSEAGVIDGHPQRWRSTAAEIRELIESRHFDSERGTYLATPDDRGLDAAVLLGVFMGYEPSSRDRWHGTLEAIDRELGAGPLLYRLSALRGQERTFLPCAFWRAHALVRLDRLDEARDVLDQLIRGIGRFGLLSEELAEDGSAWGNIPQALTHAALINACVTYEQRAAVR